MLFEDVMKAAGRTPVVRLNRLVVDGRCEVYVKLEGLNPGGSIKDRTAFYILERAERDGLLKRGDTIVESTSGNLGRSLAIAGAVKGYQVILVVDPKAPAGMLEFARALGAEIELVEEVDEDGGYQKSRLERVARLRRELSDVYWPNQYGNPWNPEIHYRATATEILEDFDYLDVLVGAVSTGGHLTGIARRLREAFPHLTTIAVDADGSAAFGLAFRPYAIRGIGLSWAPCNLATALVDWLHLVSDAEAISTCRLLARFEGVLVGESSGAATFAALSHVCHNPGRRVLVIAPDSGEHYLAESFNDEWCAAHGISALSSSVNPESLWAAAAAPVRSPMRVRAATGESVERQAGNEGPPVPDGRTC
jgi:cystathionine beta-synthase/cysteine synthase A